MYQNNGKSGIAGHSSQENWRRQSLDSIFADARITFWVPLFHPKMLASQFFPVLFLSVKRRGREKHDA
jgi:hypothetical protein